MIVAFTGHRPDKLGPRRNMIAGALIERLTALRADDDGEFKCISGMAIGFDQWAAGVCIELGIPFIAAVPFRGQESLWSQYDQLRYQELLTKAVEVKVVSPGGYSVAKMQRRNEWMVDNCDHVIAAWDGSSGGTANCVRYVKKVGRAWENLLVLSGEKS